MTALAGWGRVPVVDGDERLAEDLAAAGRDARLARGLGRSYGDASLPGAAGDVVLGTRRADRVLAFDPEAGVLRAEAGLSLRALNRVFARRGWTTPVSPGTEFVTLGGMVAADVHGKNHHVAGTFGEHVRALRVLVPDGRVLEIGPSREPELFRATLGGMGLVGHVLEVEVALERIASPWILAESERFDGLDGLVPRLRAASEAWPFTVCWVDASAGRGILIAGRWADAGEAPREPPPARAGVAVPCELPSGFLQPAFVRAFNRLHWRRHGAATRREVVHPQAFFHPLDRVLAWNRLYGRAGFVQHQCVVDERAVPAVFETLARDEAGSYLTVVKDCGAEGSGMLSFPKPGVSIALDLPMRAHRTRALVDRLNEAVIEGGGRVYLAKDALTRAEHFRAMEPRLDAFAAVRDQWDPGRRLRSALSVRLLGDGA